MLLRSILSFVIALAIHQYSLAQFGDLRKKLQEKAAEVVKDKIVEKTDEKQSEYDTTSFNYAIAFLDKTESFQNRQEGERLVKAANFVLKDDKEKSEVEEARDLYEMGRLSYSRRGYFIAEAYLNGAKLAYEIIGETSDPIYLKTLGTLALLYSDMGRFDRAEELTEMALSGWQSANGESSAGYAAEYNNKAVLTFSQGKLNVAEKELMQSLKQLEAAEGKESMPYAIGLNNLGILFQYMGRFDDALSYLDQCLDIASEEVKEKSATYVQFMTNKALIQQESGDYKGAEATYKEAMDIQTSRLKLNSSSDPDYAHMLNNLASLYMESGREDEAKELLIKSLNIYKTKFGSSHLLTASAQSDLGNVYLYQGDLSNASSMLQSAYNIYERLLGADHPKTIGAKESLAVLSWKKGESELANDQFKEVLDASLSYINEFFPSLSEVEKTRYWQQYKPKFLKYYSFVCDQANENPALVGQMLNYRIKTKGLLLSSSTRIRNTILSSGDSELISMFEQWQDQKRMLSTYYSFSKEELSEQKINLDSLETAANLSEKQLSELSSDFSGTFVDLDLDYAQIASKLKQNEAIIEIIQIPDVLKTGSSNYVGIYLDNAKVEMIRFQNAGEFDTKYYRLYANLVKQKLEDSYSYDVLWSPIDQFLVNKKNVYLSPDGIYNQMNVNTLRSSDGSYVIDKYKVAYLGNPKDYLTIEDGIVQGQAFLMGYPTYSSSSVVPLPGTKKEVEMINSTLKTGGVKTNLYTESDASESTVKASANPSIMHIATHGFFLENKASDSKVFGVTVDYANDNPLLRSGLLLAGNNDVSDQSFDGVDNGVLTAYEAINLSLSNTDLVVLSACETGKGEVQSGEGVYGLQRAFMVAGAHALIMSLWKVDDDATQKLMSALYKKLMVDKQPLSEAFRNAQLEVKKSYDHPNYWGAFVLLQ